MPRQTKPRALVCDDDPVLRAVLRSLLEDAGYRVVAETGSTTLAIEELEHQRIDVATVDLALTTGRGEELLAYMHEKYPDVQSVVFSAFVEDVETLQKLGAAAVFDKPSFDELQEWLTAQVEQPAFESRRGHERRRPPQPAPVLPDRSATSPSHLEPWTLIRACVDKLWPGDAILGLDLFREDATTYGDPVLALDHRLAMPRLIGPSLRFFDRLGMTPSGVTVCLLVAGHPEAPAVVFDRLQAAWLDEGLSGTPIGALSHVRHDEHPEVTLTRVLSRLADEQTTITHPLRLA